jgi:hypothetical protein
MRSAPTRGLVARFLGLFVGSFGSLLLLSALTQANTGPATEIRVSLFGQPCVLQGPADERTLRLIHSLSPEQLYPQRDTSLASAPTRRALDKLHSISGAPAALDRYRERLGKRLEAQVALLETLESFQKTHKPTPVYAVGKKYLAGRRLKEFDAAIKKAEGTKVSSSAADSIFDAFSDGIEPDPEEEFHRAIHRMNVQYTCSFEETGESAGGDAAD